MSKESLAELFKNSAAELIKRGPPPEPTKENPGRLVSSLDEIKKSGVSDPVALVTALAHLLDLDHWRSECASYDRLKRLHGAEKPSS